MMSTTASRVAGSAAPLSKLGLLATLPVIVLLLAQIGLYVWMAPRGFDFTDESFYFLHYLYWRDLDGIVSFFGAYFELPFQLLGQSVAAMRVLSLLLLLASSAFFAREALGYFSRLNGTKKETPLAFVVVSMAASLFYFGYLTTLRAPSYNLLALCSMLVSTGLLLRVLERSIQFANPRLAMFCYGLTIGACGLGKASSGVMLVVVHALFFALANRDWRLRHLLEFLVLSIIGASLNFAVLQWADSHWLDLLRAGLSMTGMDGSHSLLGSVKELWWDVNAMLPKFLSWAIDAEIIVVFLVRWFGPSRRTALSTLVLAIVGGCALGLMWAPASLWLPMLGLAVLLLWSIDVFSSEPFQRLTRGGMADFALMALLFTLPITFSFGTNMPLLEHSQMAAIFAITALSLRLFRLAQLGILAAPALILCLVALCLPTLVIQLRAATDVHYTYRQLSALGEQAMPVQLGAAGNTILVDAITRKTLQSVIGSARAVGLTPGQSILDFTGDGPGLIYAIGGRPLGKAWLLGGYPGSQNIAANMVERLPVKALQNAWLLSSDNNPRAIKGWQQLLNRRLGPGSHELVATVSIHAPYRWGENAPESIFVQFWKPLVSKHSAGQ